MTRTIGALLLALTLACAFGRSSTPSGDRPEGHDVVVYGGTSAGVIAAVQTASMGKSVLLVKPDRHLGGLSAGGLGATDIGNKAAIGGLARDFYRRVHRHYAADEAWTVQRREDYRSRRMGDSEDTMWTFEPHVAEGIFEELLREAGVEVIRGRLDRRSGIEMADGRILSITLESGRHLHGRMFVDATYEGDLMALAGVTYRVGREANDEHGETLNGIQTAHARYHQFRSSVDPWVCPGDPESGLLPGIEKKGGGRDGDGDARVQAYNFRMCLTDAPENRIPFSRPEGYNAREYELLLRTIESDQWDAFRSNTPMPNRKTDTNNCGPVSTDFIGRNHDYPEAGYAERERIVRAHETYQKGLMWFLANEPRVPEEIRREVGAWGLCKDEFTDRGGWPHQIYVREARRMVADYVMTQHDCQARRIALDPVGLAAYTMDSHHVRRYVEDGRVWNEGDVQVGGFPPYPISYRSIVPRRGECGNLLVPVCLSATHIAFGSIRMEPVFMVLGQSAATAACLALDRGVTVQDVDYASLQERLLADGQILSWGSGPRTVSRDPAELPGTILDDDRAELVGEWVTSVSVHGFVGEGYLHDDDAAKGEKLARFPLRVTEPTRLRVRLTWTPHGNRSSRVPVAVQHAEGVSRSIVDQRRPPAGDDGFQDLGTFRFEPGEDAWIEITNDVDDGHVIVDAVQLLEVD